MKPKEFVARVIDLFKFDLGKDTGWSELRPTNFSAASLCISMCASPTVIEASGYTFKLEAEECLGHTVVRATMFATPGPEDLIALKLRGSICFTYQNYDSLPQATEDVPVHEHIFESWDMAQSLRMNPEEIASMITFLTMKTNYQIKHKRFP